jgi:hypothetical protein
MLGHRMSPVSHPLSGVVVYLRSAVHVVGFRAPTGAEQSLRSAGWQRERSIRSVWRCDDSSLMAWYDSDADLWCVGQRFGFLGHLDLQRTVDAGVRIMEAAPDVQRILPVAIQLPVINVGSLLQSPSLPSRSESLWEPEWARLGGMVPAHCRITAHTQHGRTRLAAEIVAGSRPLTRLHEPRKAFYRGDARRVGVSLPIDDVSIWRTMIARLLWFAHSAEVMDIAMAPALRTPHRGQIARVASFDGARIMVDVTIPTVSGRCRFIASEDGSWWCEK